MAQVQIVDAVEIFSLEGDRLGKKDLMVQYSVGGGVPKSVVIPLETVTRPDGTVDLNRVQAAVREAEKRTASLKGHTFPL